METLARWRVYICCGPDCTARRSPALLDVAEREVAAAGLSADVEVMPSGCMKHCERGPSLALRPGPFFYERIDPGRLRRIVRQHLRDDRPIPEWFYDDPEPVVSRGAFAPPPDPLLPRRPLPPSAAPGRGPVPPPRSPRPTPPPRRRPAPEVDDFKW